MLSALIYGFIPCRCSVEASVLSCLRIHRSLLQLFLHSSFMASFQGILKENGLLKMKAAHGLKRTN